MRIIILYSTKSGASQQCAELLSKQLNDCVICDISKMVPDVTSYDIIIIGSGVRMGKLYKPALNFIKTNETLLLTKKIGIYLCNAYPNTFQKVVEKNISQSLIQSAACIESFGGKIPFSSEDNMDWLILENVAAFMQVVLQTE